MCKYKSNSGFTLVELLVVMSIIAMLSGMMVGTIAIQRKSAKTKAASANIKRIKVALNNYYHDMYAYPETPEFPGSATLYKSLTGDLDVNLAYEPENDDIPLNHSRWKKPYLSFKKNEVDADGNLLDPWGHPYRYFENETGDPNFAANPNSYIIYSLGPDGKASEVTKEEILDFTLDGNKDNIKNWRDE